MWSGPLPPPEVLREFGDAVPGADELILEEFREQGAHRRSIESRESKTAGFVSRVVAVSVSGLPYLTLATGAFLTYSGLTWPGLAVIAAPIIILARKGGSS